MEWAQRGGRPARERALAQPRAGGRLAGPVGAARGSARARQRPRANQLNQSERLRPLLLRRPMGGESQTPANLSAGELLLASELTSERANERTSERKRRTRSSEFVGPKWYCFHFCSLSPFLSPSLLFGRVRWQRRPSKWPDEAARRVERAPARVIKMRSFGESSSKHQLAQASKSQ